MRLLAAGLALLAAMGFAVSAVLQGRAARSAPMTDALRVRLLLDLAKRPVWLLSVASMVVAYVTQAIALFFANVAFVEPLVATELVFALPFAVRAQRRRLAVQEWVGALAVVGGVGTFLAVAQPHGGTADPSPLLWVLSGASVAGLIVVLVLAATTWVQRIRAALLAAAAGTAFATLALVTKSVTYLVDAHGLGVFAYWQPYALIVIGISGFVLSQSAYQSGSLESSLPVIDTVEPILAVLLGVLTFGEVVPHEVGSLAAQVVGGAVAAAGVVLLGRSALIRGAYGGVPIPHADAPPVDPVPRRPT